MYPWKRWIIAVGLILTSAATAQPAAPEDTTARPDARERVARARVLLEEVLLARLTKELALDEAQTERLARHLVAYRTDMTQLRRERGRQLRALRQALRDNQDERQIQPMIDALFALDEKLLQTRQSALEVPDLSLTAPQKARLLVFIHDFEADMRKLLKRAEERRKHPPEPTAP